MQDEVGLLAEEQPYRSGRRRDDRRTVEDRAELPGDLALAELAPARPR